MCVGVSERPAVKDEIKEQKDELKIDDPERVPFQQRLAALQQQLTALQEENLKADQGGRQVRHMLQCLRTCIYYMITDWMHPCAHMTPTCCNTPSRAQHPHVAAAFIDVLRCRAVVGPAGVVATLGVRCTHYQLASHLCVYVLMA